LSSDWELLERAGLGDERAWSELVRRHHQRLLGMVLLITGSPEAAEDISQEAFVRLFRSRLERRGSVGGWLSTTAYRLAVKENRRGQHRSVLDGIDLPDPSGSPLDTVLTEERDRHVAAAIRALDPPHRDVMVLRFYGGHRYEEIARLTGVPLGTVKSRIFHAVKSCQTILRERGILE
jgi:RNA polymerase sigma-70 factor (ECF subfamily)